MERERTALSASGSNGGGIGPQDDSLDETRARLGAIFERADHLMDRSATVPIERTLQQQRQQRGQ